MIADVLTARPLRGFLRIVQQAALVALMAAGAALADVPAMPTVVAVPPSESLPLSSAGRPGTEYSDLRKAGYTEEEYYLAGVAPAITAAGKTLFEAPYVTRILVRKPTDAARFNGTVIIEPFSWFGERAAGWILTREILLRRGYAHVGYTLNINKPQTDPKFVADTPEAQADGIKQYGAIVNLEFMRRYDYARYAPLGNVLPLCVFTLPISRAAIPHHPALGRPTTTTPCSSQRRPTRS